jgi:hypothetical protein
VNLLQVRGSPNPKKDKATTERLESLHSRLKAVAFSEGFADEVVCICQPIVIERW